MVEVTTCEGVGWDVHLSSDVGGRKVCGYVGFINPVDGGYFVVILMDWESRSADWPYEAWVSRWSQVTGVITAGLNELSQRHSRERRTVPLTRRTWREGVAREHVDARQGGYLWRQKWAKLQMDAI